MPRKPAAPHCRSNPFRIPETYDRDKTKPKTDTRDSSNSFRSRVKLQARSIANDRYHSIMDLCTNAGIVSDAIKSMEGKKEQLDTLQKIDERTEEEKIGEKQILIQHCNPMNKCLKLITLYLISKSHYDYH